MSSSSILDVHIDALVLPLLHHHLNILKTKEKKKPTSAKMPLPPEALHQGVIQGILDTRDEN